VELCHESLWRPGKWLLILVRSRWSQTTVSSRMFEVAARGAQVGVEVSDLVKGSWRGQAKSRYCVSRVGP
jgi:hypothetical protein